MCADINGFSVKIWRLMLCFIYMSCPTPRMATSCFLKLNYYILSFRELVKIFLVISIWSWINPDTGYSLYPKDNRYCLIRSRNSLLERNLFVVLMYPFQSPVNNYCFLNSILYSDPRIKVPYWLGQKWEITEIFFRFRSQTDSPLKCCTWELSFPRFKGFYPLNFSLVRFELFFPG